MSEKWADHAISAVRYNADGTRVVAVRVRADNGAMLGVANEMQTSRVLGLIEDGATFVTVFENGDGRWRRGPHVIVVRVQGRPYLRTAADAIAADDLGDLPRF